ncbi:unnamed protein product [Didymodactylos carnosus]|uniref:LITAF domain-containing protein n=1 Tax=Didymodactylos carnosus TaxID=1234261 RepID=A0A815GCY7_9BILA|nr:unnamed protein product [Didymodactylos carnosus]CAF1338014.1 unnamed protein product [Didymodactylos carnosus]CAF3630528.1 unnamed protein product [Didymodactylos carnosus]CAF4196805.1 unnamed protein product [Didymodactylos carnosus]
MAEVDFNNFAKAGLPDQNPPPYQAPPYPTHTPQTFQPGLQSQYNVTVGHPPTSAVFVTQHIPFLGSQPASITCSVCRAQVITRVDYVSGPAAWLICFIIAMFGGIFGCCLIPFCVDSLKDAYHYCPVCNAQIGIRKVM